MTVNDPMTNSAYDVVPVLLENEMGQKVLKHGAIKRSLQDSNLNVHNLNNREELIKKYTKAPLPPIKRYTKAPLPPIKKDINNNQRPIIVETVYDSGAQSRENSDSTLDSANDDGGNSKSHPGEYFENNLEQQPGENLHGNHDSGVIAIEYDEKLVKKSGPVQLYVEYLIVSDSTLYNNFLSILPAAASGNVQVAIQYMQIYFAQAANAINQRYLLSLQNDANLMINVVLTGIYIETVCMFFKFLKEK